MKKTVITTIFLALACVVTARNLTDSLQFKARAGYSIGGTAPIGLPASIRSIDAFRLTPSFMVGFDIGMPLNEKWGIATGLHFENKAMDGEVTTKGYHMELRKGSELINGLFTGHVKQEVKEWMFTIPLQATYRLGHDVTLKAGPYFSLLLSNEFSGIASDGYLRDESPVGPKIIIGNKEGEWATYDFSDEMRKFQMGIGAGIDWQFYKNWGVSADLNWGLTGIFKSDFKTVEQTLYPIYGTIGVFYTIK